MSRKCLSLVSKYAVFALAIVLTRFVVLKAAPVHDYTEIEQYADGCYYNYHHYNEGDRIITNEPCLNCTCHNKMLMCYLRVCPFTRPISHECTVEKREDQCCPIITCPEVPVGIDEEMVTDLGDSANINERFGCNVAGKLYPQGAQVPSNPNKPCELCYCIKNRTSCLMQECTLHIESCTPIYNRGTCCPVRYNCDHENDDDVLELEDHSESSTRYTTERTTPGFVLTTTIVPQQALECSHNGKLHPDGTRIYRENACENCYCMRGDIICAVQECNQPMLSSNGVTCQALPSNSSECCPKNYICDQETPTTTTTTTTTTGMDGILGTTQIAYTDRTEPSKMIDMDIDKMHESISQDDIKLQTHIEADEETTIQTEYPLLKIGKLNEKVTRLIDKGPKDFYVNEKFSTPKDFPEYSTEITSISPTMDDTEKYETETMTKDHYPTSFYPEQSTSYDFVDEYGMKSTREPVELTSANQKTMTTTMTYKEDAAQEVNAISDHFNYYTIVPNDYSTIQSLDKESSSTTYVGSTKLTETVTETMKGTMTSQFEQTTEASASTINDKDLLSTTEIVSDSGSSLKEVDENIEEKEEEEEGISTTTARSKSNRNITDEKKIAAPFELEYFGNDLNGESEAPQNTEPTIDTHEKQDEIDRIRIFDAMTTVHDLGDLDLSATKADEFNELATTSATTNLVPEKDEKDEKGENDALHKIVPGKKTFKIASFNSELLDEEIYFDAQTLTPTTSDDLMEHFSGTTAEAIPKTSEGTITESIQRNTSDGDEATIYDENQTDSLKEDSKIDTHFTTEVETEAGTVTVTVTETGANDYRMTDRTPAVIEDEETRQEIEHKDMNFTREPSELLEANVEAQTENLLSTPVVTEGTTFVKEESTLVTLSTISSMEYNEEYGSRATTLQDLKQLAEIEPITKMDKGPPSEVTVIYDNGARYTTEGGSDQLFEKDLKEAMPSSTEKFVSYDFDAKNLLPTDGPLNEIDRKEEAGEILIDLNPTTPTEAKGTDESTSKSSGDNEMPAPAIHSINSINESLPHTIPGEGSCLVGERTIENNGTVPTPINCKISCKCINSIVICEHLACHIPEHLGSCILSNTSFENCCPIYICDAAVGILGSGANKEIFQTSLSKLDDSVMDEDALYTVQGHESTSPHSKEPLTETTSTTEEAEKMQKMEKIFSSHPYVPILNESIQIHYEEKEPHLEDLKDNESFESELASSTIMSPSSPSLTTSPEDLYYDKLPEADTDKPTSFNYFIPNTAPPQLMKTDSMEATTNDSTDKYFNEQLHSSTESDDYATPISKVLHLDSVAITNTPNYTASVYDRETPETSTEHESELISPSSTMNDILADKIVTEMLGRVTELYTLDDGDYRSTEVTASTVTIPPENATAVKESGTTFIPAFDLTTTSKIIQMDDENEKRKQFSEKTTEQGSNVFTEINSLDNLSTTPHFETNYLDTSRLDDDKNIQSLIKLDSLDDQLQTSTALEVDLNAKLNYTPQNFITEITTTASDIDGTQGTVNIVTPHSKVTPTANYFDTSTKLDDKILESSSAMEPSTTTATIFSSSTKIEENPTQSSTHSYEASTSGDRLFNDTVNLTTKMEATSQPTITPSPTPPPSASPTRTPLPITTTMTSTTTTTTTRSTITTATSQNANNDNYQNQLPIYAQPPQYPSYPDDDYTEEDEAEVFGPGTCRYGGKLYVSAQQIPRDDPCDFCFCFRSDIICLQQSCPPPITGCHEEPIIGFCCPRYECPISVAGGGPNHTLESTTTSTTLSPSFPYFSNTKSIQRLGCMINGRSYVIGERIESTSGPCINCLCGGDGNMKCDPQACIPEPTMQQVMAAVAAGRKR